MRFIDLGLTTGPPHFTSRVCTHVCKRSLTLLEAMGRLRGVHLRATVGLTGGCCHHCWRCHLCWPQLAARSSCKELGPERGEVVIVICATWLVDEILDLSVFKAAFLFASNFHASWHCGARSGNWSHYTSW